MSRRLGLGSVNPHTPHHPSLFSLTHDVRWFTTPKSLGDHQQPLCFVLPTQTAFESMEMHRHLVDHVVKPGDRFINVFPKNQEEIEKVGCFWFDQLVVSRYTRGPGVEAYPLNGKCS